VICPNLWQPLCVNGGHECLVVQFSSPSEGADDLKFHFDAFQDRHVAQKNLWVSNNQPGQKLQLVVGNPFLTTELFKVQLSTMLVTGEMRDFRLRNVQVLMQQIGSARVQQTEAGGQNLKLHVSNLTDRDFGVRLTKTRKIKRFGNGHEGQDLTRYLYGRARQSPDFNPDTLGRELAEFVLQPEEARVLDFDLPPANVGGGNFLVHHFTQVVAGCDVGGYTVVVPPADFLWRL
jgi:hypothetical protein